MIRALREIRLSWPAFAVVAGASILASALVLSSALGRTPAQSAALAALHSRPDVIRLPTTQPSPAGGGPAAASAGSASASVAGNTGSAVAESAGASGADSAGSDAGTDAGATDGAAATDTSTTGTTTSTTTTTASSTLPKVDHVFLIALSTRSYATVFGARSAAPYLRSLEPKGALLSGYESLDGSELPDYIAMVSGQGPNPDTHAGCPTYSEFAEGTAARANGLVDGAGCVYPETALTIGDQVTASGHVWKAYIADMGSTPCVHPNSGAADDVGLPGTQPGYDTRHNPFIFFHSLLDLGDCENDDVDLGQLSHDLAKRSRTATFSFIAPGGCADAAVVASGARSDGAARAASTLSVDSSALTTTSALTTGTVTTATTTTPTTAAASTTTTTPPATTPTATTPTTTSTTTTATTTTPASTTPAAAGSCQPGQPIAVAAENAFLRAWVPKILDSAAYKEDGLLVIALAGDSAGPVRTGALVLSPDIHGGKTLTRAFTPYSLLRSTEDLLGYTPLAHAASAASFAATLLG
ncbi:MAG: hypothetical protein ACLP22_16170 [Solirubrobacteraceae bacterium]